MIHHDFVDSADENTLPISPLKTAFRNSLFRSQLMPELCVLAKADVDAVLNCVQFGFKADTRGNPVQTNKKREARRWHGGLN